MSGVAAALPDRVGPSGRFQAGTDIVRLYDQIAAVARFATSGDEQKAAKLSKGQWDIARVSSGSDLPLAESIRQREGLTWPELLHCALLPAQKRSVYLRNRRDPNWGRNFGELSEEYLLGLLRSVALRLAPGTPLTERRFDEEIRRMEQESRRWKVAEPLWLPRSVQIIVKFGKWNNGLGAAGIPPIFPIPSAKVKLADAVSALELAYAKLGKLPTASYFREWCRLEDISLPTRFQYTPEVLAELARRRANQGLLTSLEPVNGWHLPKLAAPVGRRQVRWTRDQALGALRIYAALCKDPKAIPTQKDYCLKSSGNPLLPSVGVIQRFGGFTDLCKEAGIL